MSFEIMSVKVNPMMRLVNELLGVKDEAEDGFRLIRKALKAIITKRIEPTYNDQ